MAGGDVVKDDAGDAVVLLGRGRGRESGALLLRALREPDRLPSGTRKTKKNGFYGNVL